MVGLGWLVCKKLINFDVFWRNAVVGCVHRVSEVFADIPFTLEPLRVRVGMYFGRDRSSLKANG